MAEDLDAFEEAYAMAKLPPRLTGDPRRARTLAPRRFGPVRPQPREIVRGSMTATEFTAVGR